MPASDGIARIRLDLAGREKVRAGITGTTSELRRAQKQMADASKATTAAATRDARARTTAVTRGTREETAAVKKSEEEKRRQLRDTAREAERSARTQARASRRAEREAGGGGAGRAATGGGRRQTQTSPLQGAAQWAMGLASVSSILSQIGQVLSERSNALRAHAGVASATDQLTQGLDFEELTSTVTRQRMQNVRGAPYDRRLAGIREGILSTATETNTAPLELARGLQVWQETFSDLDFGESSMLATARAAQAMNIEFSEAVNILGEAKDKYRLSAEQTEEFFAVLATQGLAGKITPGQMAREFAPSFGAHRALTGRGGMEGYRELGAMANVIASEGGGTVPEAATRTEAVIRALNDTTTQEALARMTGGRERQRRNRFTGERETYVQGGLQVRNADGSFMALPEIFERMAASEAFSGPGASERLQEVFTDIRGNMGAAALLRDAQDARAAGGQSSFRDIMGVDAGAGAAFNDLAFREKMSTHSAAMKRVGIQSQVAAARGGAVAAGADTAGEAVSESFQSRAGGIASSIADMAGLGGASWLRGQWFKAMRGMASVDPTVAQGLQQSDAGLAKIYRGAESTMFGQGTTPEARQRMELEISESAAAAFGRSLAGALRSIGLFPESQPAPGSGGGRLQPGGARARTPGGG